MYTYDGKEIEQSRIIERGQLVRIGSVLTSLRNNGNIGIIIECTYGFGINGNEWLVLINGKLQRVEGSMVWPLEDMNAKK